ncbi:MAG: hypothetical protein AB7H90_07455 [Alphaproteobacteria bacterium]
MSIIKNFGTSGRTAVLGAAVLAAASLTLAPGSAYAQHRGGHGWHGGHWRGGDHWRGNHHWRGHHRHGWRGGDAAALGLLGGALAGAAIAGAANQYPYYGYSYPYSYGYAYPYYYGYGY